jgi:hypothetical protein
MQWIWASVAALGIIAGAFISWQRDRERFILARMAIEKGLGAVPGMPAPWIRSLRSALSILIVGIGLMIVGGAAWGLARGGQSPEAALVAADAELASQGSTTRPTPMPMMQPPPPPPHRGPGESEPPPPPPVFSPAFERWHQAREREKQQTVGLECAAAGFVLTLLGLVRLGVAKAESQYTQEERSQTDETRF